MPGSSDADELESLRSLSQLTARRLAQQDASGDLGSPQTGPDLDIVAVDGNTHDFPAEIEIEEDGDNTNELEEDDDIEIDDSDSDNANDSANDSGIDHDSDNEEDDEDNDEDSEDDHGGDGNTAPPYGSFLFRNLLQRGLDGPDPSILDVMQRLVGGIDASPFERQLSEYDGLVDNLTQRDDPYLIMETLNELLERLLMMNGITAERVISPHKMARALVGILKDERLADDLELHLVACRCLYNFIEVNQDFIHDALNCDAVEVLVHTVLEITYIDLTEQALQTLEMISREPSAHALIVASNGLKACLQNLDFLTVHAQRKCLTIVANACTNIPTAHFALVHDEFSKLAAVAENHTDAVVVENTWLAISRIVISYKMRPDFLEQLFFDDSILTQMASVICSSCNPSSTELGLKYQSNIMLIKSLITLASSSVNISLLLLKIRIGRYIGNSLTKFKKVDDQKHRAKTDSELTPFEPDQVSIEALVAAPKDILSHFLHLIGYLLPITYNPQETPFLDSGHRDHEVKTKINTERAASYRSEGAGDYSTFVNDVWPVLARAFQATMDYEIRRSVLIDMSRIISFAEESDFSKIKGIEEFAGILASIITSGKKKFVEADPEVLLNSKQPLGAICQDLLLLSTILMALKILWKSNNSWVTQLEKEGFFNDLLAILEALKSVYPDISSIEQEVNASNERSQSTDQRTTINLSSAFYNKYADKELTKDYEYKLTSEQIYKELRVACHKLESVYKEIKNLSETSNSLAGGLGEILSTLSALTKSENDTYENWHSVWLSLKEIVCSETNPVSTFELISLGITSQVCNVFIGEDDTISGITTPRVASFLQVFYDDLDSFSRFVDLLQDSLTRSESFEIVTSGGNALNGGSSASVMTKQIKLKLVAEDSGDIPAPSQMQLFTLSVHSIATFKSIVAFLKQRYMFHDLVNKGVLDPLKSGDDDSEEVAIKSPNNGTDSLNIEFSVNGNPIPTETTIYGAVYRAIQTEKQSSKVEPQEVWLKSHQISYRFVNSQKDTEPQIQVMNYDNDLEELEQTTSSILKLLKVLFSFNQSMSKRTHAVLSTEKFMNWKLTVKLNRQLEEPLIIASGTLPSWSITLTKGYPFLFPLETRMFFLQSTSFGYSRLIHNWQLRSNQEQLDDQSRNSFTGGHTSGLQLGRPLRRKVRVSRKFILQSALKVLHLYGSSPGILEIEYFDEVGSGLGPTLEFYSSVSNEFCKKSLCMWRDESDVNEGEHVSALKGLFPRAMDLAQIVSENGKKTLFLFSALGTFVARSLLDSRIVDFTFNTLFLKLIQNLGVNPVRSRGGAIDLHHALSVLKEVDSNLATSLEHLLQFAETNKSNNLKIVDDTIEDLSLYFVLPGNPNYELVPNGADVPVTSTNLQSYIEMVVEATVYSGVINQVKAFMEGFSKVFPISSLTIFSPQELSEIFGNSEEDWSRDTLADAIKANHGFTRESVAIHRLINVLSSFSDLERRKFLQFLTGSPKLPIGGFKSIRPEFTVVKKRPENGLSSDNYLPSVMTCANYLKLPDYSLEEIMRDMLLHAVIEGAGAFHLS